MSDSRCSACGARLIPVCGACHQSVEVDGDNSTGKAQERIAELEQELRDADRKPCLRCSSVDEFIDALQRERDEARQVARDIYGDLPSHMSDTLFQKEYGDYTAWHPWLKE